MREQRWQDRTVTYGCLVRLSLISATILLIVAATVVLILNIGGTFWSTSSTAVLLGLSVLFAFLQWRFPPSPHTPPPGDTISSGEQSTSSPAQQAYNTLRGQEESLFKKEGQVPESEQTGTLMVKATQAHIGKTVYLLPRDVWNRTPSTAARDSNSQKQRAIITQLTVNFRPIYVAVFRNLKEGAYIVWTSYGKDNPKKVAVEVFPNRVSDLELDWLD